MQKNRALARCQRAHASPRTGDLLQEQTGAEQTSIRHVESIFSLHFHSAPTSPIDGLCIPVRNDVDLGIMLLKEIAP